MTLPLPTLLGVMMLLHIALWWMGGTFHKSLRRIVLPVTTGILLALTGVIWWKVALCAIAESVVNHLGYGEDDPIIKRIATLLAIGVPAVVLNYNVWYAPVITLVQFGVWYIASRRFNFVWWPLAEMSAGFAQGATIVLARLR